MNAESKIVQSDPSSNEVLPYRKVIDRVVMLRALVMRVGLTVTQMSLDITDERRQELRETARNYAGKLAHMLGVLRGETTFDDMPEALNTWLAKVGKDQHSAVSDIARMNEMTRTLCAAAETEEGATNANLDKYIAYGQGAFFDTITGLSDSMWSEVDAERDRQMQHAMESATRLGEGLGRLERIGRYVRSMSINASVEASRAGESGKGLAIIAQEFKVLAEEVQQVAVSARKDVENLENS